MQKDFFHKICDLTDFSHLNLTERHYSLNMVTQRHFYHENVTQKHFSSITRLTGVLFNHVFPHKKCYSKDFSFKTLLKRAGWAASLPKAARTRSVPCPSDVAPFPAPQGLPSQVVSPLTDGRSRSFHTCKSSPPFPAPQSWPSQPASSPKAARAWSVPSFGEPIKKQQRRKS